jgi:hypothetical protein
VCKGRKQQQLLDVVEGASQCRRVAPSVWAPARLRHTTPQAYQAALSRVLPDGAHNPELEAAIEGMNTHNAWQVRVRVVWLVWRGGAAATTGACVLPLAPSLLAPPCHESTPACCPAPARATPVPPQAGGQRCAPYAGGGGLARPQPAAARAVGRPAAAAVAGCCHAGVARPARAGRAHKPHGRRWGRAAWRGQGGLRGWRLRTPWGPRGARAVRTPCAHR